MVPLMCLISLYLFIVYDTDQIFLNITNHAYWPMLAFWVLFITLAMLTFVKRFSTIPVLGMVTNFYLMAQLNFTNWAAFLIWLCVGLVVYLSYGVRKSKLAIHSS